MALVLAVNGEIYTVANPDPGTRLIDFLRTETPYTSPKVGCGEGGCGACAVLVQEIDVSGNSQGTPQTVCTRTTNACLTPLCSMFGKHVVTTEGLGSSTEGFHPVQKRVADYNGTQCGFCTPGMVMSIYAQLEASDGKPTEREMENCFDGQLCRCTGYRPLLDAAKSFAIDSKVRDFVGVKGHKADTGAIDAEIFERHRPTFPAEQLAAAMASAAIPSEVVTKWSGSGRTWARPLTIPQIELSIRAHLQQQDARFDGFKLVNGNTSSGVYKKYGGFDPTTLIDISGVAALRKITEATLADGRKGIRFGGSVTIEAAMQALKRRLDVTKTSEMRHLPVILEHMHSIAGRHVRSAGSLSGNLMMVKQWGFASDLATVLTTAGALIDVQVFVRSKANEASGENSQNVSVQRRTMDLGAFLVGDDGINGSSMGFLILGIMLPFAKPGEIMKTYKSALRPQNAHALVNAGFRLCFDNDGAVSDAVIVYGAVNERHPVRASALENHLTRLGRAVRSEDEEALLSCLAEDIKVEHSGYSLNSSGPNSDQHMQTGERGHSDLHRVAHRERLVVNFFKKFMMDVLLRPSTDVRNEVDASRTSDTFAATAGGYRRAVSQAIQELPGGWEEHAPVSLPVPKLTARLSASGEAKFTADGPLPARTAFCHFVQAYKPGRVFRGLSITEALKCPGVIKIIEAKDIRGDNNSSALRGEKNKERLLVEIGGDPVQYAGEPCAIVVADTQVHAERAARTVKVLYEDIDGSGIASNAIASSAAEAAELGIFLKRNDSDAHLERHDDGFSNVSEALNASPLISRGLVSCGSQKHFPMETQTALAVPEEAGKMTVQSSSQYPTGVQRACSTVLFGSNVDRSMVTAKTRRVGGAFGCKLTRHTPVAAAAAVAAQLCRRPALMMLTRNQDMEMTGGRGEISGRYEVGFDPDTGMLKALKVKLFMDCGFSQDLSDFCVMALARAIEQCYYVPELEIDVTPLKTRTPTRTAVRGPSEIESSYIIETILSHVASLCPSPELTSDRVREVNFFPSDKLVNADGQKIPQSCWTIPRMWSQLKKTADVEDRRRAVLEFNSAPENIGRRKRGISCSTVKYALGAGFQAALVNILSDGSIQITHSGVEIGQGIHTKTAQVAAWVLGRVLLSEGGVFKDGNSEVISASTSESLPGHLHYYPSSASSQAAGVLLRHVVVSDTSTEKIPNMSMTGGSTTSESCCGAVRLACEELVRRLLPIKENVLSRRRDRAPEGKNVDHSLDSISWRDLISAASRSKVNLSAQRAWRRGVKPNFAEEESEKLKHKYCAFGVACSEVELDQLTGESKILRTDIVYDCGKPLNPAVDLGQIEGGFMMGIGFFFREQVQRTLPGPSLWNHGTWEYKPPCSLDVPIDFRVSYLEKTKHDSLVLSSKASGEPPLVLATSAFMALRDAVYSARRENGIGEDFFPLYSPAMVDNVLSACCGADDEVMSERLKSAWKEDEDTTSSKKTAGCEGEDLSDVTKQFR